MPLVGLLSFLQKTGRRNLEKDGCVNALSRASLISTRRALQKGRQIVSMPLVGLLSFLHL